MLFGRNRESRSREAAGRRNWPEAVPKKMRDRKRLLARFSENRVREYDGGHRSNEKRIEEAIDFGRSRNRTFTAVSWIQFLI